MRSLIVTKLVSLVLASTTIRLSNHLTSSVSTHPQISTRDVLTLASKPEEPRFEATSETKFIKTSGLPHHLDLKGLLEAATFALLNNHGLTLSPDVIFATVLHGINIHDGLAPQEKNATFPNETKRRLNLALDEFVFRGMGNDWEDAFDQYKQVVASKLPPRLAARLSGNFSTSTSLATSANAITLMKLYTPHFNYFLESHYWATRHKIPEMTLLGTHADWLALRANIGDLMDRFSDIDFWSRSLLPVIDQFVSATSPRDIHDATFWEAMLVPGGRLDDPTISGWINTFFPYLTNGTSYSKNPCLEFKDFDPTCHGIHFQNFPQAISRTPTTWNYGELAVKVELVSGLLGVSKDKLNHHVFPNFGWAVIHQ